MFKLFSKKLSKEKITQKDGELNSAQNELDNLRIKNYKLEAKCTQLQIENQTLKNQNDEILSNENDYKEKIKKLEKYREFLENKYLNLDINIPNSTYKYICKCLDNPLGLEYFDPLMYQQNSKYRYAIDSNAAYLLEIFANTQSVIEVEYYSDRYSAMGKAYYEILRSTKSDINNSNSNIARSRKNYEKISPDF